MVYWIILNRRTEKTLLFLLAALFNFLFDIGFVAYFMSSTLCRFHMKWRQMIKMDCCHHRGYILRMKAKLNKDSYPLTNYQMKLQVCWTLFLRYQNHWNDIDKRSYRAILLSISHLILLGCNKEEIAPDMRLESSHGATGSSLSLTCHLKNQNHINLAKDTLSRLKEESYILSQDRLGFTPLVSIW